MINLTKIKRTGALALSPLLFFTLLVPSAVAGNIPSSVPGKSSNPQCSTSSNASSVAKNAVTKSPIKICRTGDGLSQATAGSSASQIKRDFPSSASGLYWIKSSAINGGTPFQIYADMETDGGGWTLIVANSVNQWSYPEASLVNQSNPPLDPTNLVSQGGKYSILAYADSIKRSSSGFQYRMDANDLGFCGGIWTSNTAYSFTSQSNANTNITLNQKWGDWVYADNGLEERMPYLVDNQQARLTTSYNPSEEWWGTLIQGANWEERVTPWMSNTLYCDRPAIIWYWVK